MDPTERCGRCTLATWPLPNRLEAFFSQGDVTAVRLNLITCSARKLPTARSLQSRGRCSTRSRAEGRARRAFSYRGTGKARRRIRRLVRSRFFHNARTATRNLDLPLAIGDPISSQLLLLHRRILASAWRPQRRAFLASSGALAFFYLGGDFRTGRGHGFLRTRTSPAVSANLWIHLMIGAARGDSNIRPRH